MAVVLEGLLWLHGPLRLEVCWQHGATPASASAGREELSVTFPGVY